MCHAPVFLHSREILATYGALALTCFCCSYIFKFSQSGKIQGECFRGSEWFSSDIDVNVSVSVEVGCLGAIPNTIFSHYGRSEHSTKPPGGQRKATKEIPVKFSCNLICIGARNICQLINFCRQLEDVNCASFLLSRQELTRKQFHGIIVKADCLTRGVILHGSPIPSFQNVFCFLGKKTSQKWGKGVKGVVNIQVRFLFSGLSPSLTKTVTSWLRRQVNVCMCMRLAKFRLN